MSKSVAPHAARRLSLPSSIFFLLLLAFLLLALKSHQAFYGNVSKGNNGPMQGWAAGNPGLIQDWVPEPPFDGPAGIPGGDQGTMDEEQVQVPKDLFKSVPVAGRANAIILLDRPAYRVGNGDVVRGHVAFFSALDNTPIEAPMSAQVAILDPKGAIVNTIHLFNNEPKFFTAAFAWSIPNHAVGGEYTCRFESFQPQSIPVAERTFEVHKSTLSPKIIASIEFDKDGYQANEQVQVQVRGSDLLGAMMTISARVQGNVVFTSLEMPWTPTTKVSFRMPGVLDDNLDDDASVSVQLSKAQSFEVVTKTLTVIHSRIILNVYPETGNLVCGLGPTTVYLEALHVKTKRPVDFNRVKVVTDEGKVIVDGVASLHKGRGKVVVPASNDPLFVQMDSPPLKLPIPWRCSPLKALNADFRIVGLSPLKLDFRTAFQTIESQYRLVVSKKEVELFSRKLSGGSIAKSTQTVTFDLSSAANPVLLNEGVVRITLEDVSSGLPVAERLVFNPPSRTLDLSIRARTLDDVDKEAGVGIWQDVRITAQPGDGVQLEIKSSSEAIISVRVSEAALASTVDEGLFILNTYFYLRFVCLHRV